MGMWGRSLVMVNSGASCSIRHGQGGGDADSIVDELLNPGGDGFIGDALSIEGAVGCVDKSGHDEASKIEHHQVGQVHGGHVTAVATGSAHEADDFILEGGAGKFDEVLGRRRGREIVDGEREEYARGSGDLVLEGGDVGMCVGCVAIAYGEFKESQIKQFARRRALAEQLHRVCGQTARPALAIETR